MDEALIKVGKGSVEGRDEVDKTIAVNDMYIEAITAKLKILDQIWLFLLTMINNFIIKEIKITVWTACSSSKC